MASLFPQFRQTVLCLWVSSIITMLFYQISKENCSENMVWTEPEADRDTNRVLFIPYCLQQSPSGHTFGSKIINGATQCTYTHEVNADQFLLLYLSQRSIFHSELVIKEYSALQLGTKRVMQLQNSSKSWSRSDSEYAHFKSTKLQLWQDIFTPFHICEHSYLT